MVRARGRKLVRAAGPWAKLGWLLGSLSPYYSSLTEKKEKKREEQRLGKELVIGFGEGWKGNYERHII